MVPVIRVEPVDDVRVLRVGRLADRVWAVYLEFEHIEKYRWLEWSFGWEDDTLVITLSNDDYGTVSEIRVTLPGYDPWPFVHSFSYGAWVLIVDHDDLVEAIETGEILIRK